MRPASSVTALGAGIAHKNVQADRGCLERDEEHEEVIALREQHQGRRRHKDDVVKLSPGHPGTGQIGPGQKADQQR